MTEMNVILKICMRFCTKNYLFHFLIFYCLLSLFTHVSKSTAGQSCCYGGKNNSLLEWESSMDSGYVFRYNYRAQGPDIVPYLTHFEADILPYLHCCKYSGQNNDNLCQAFFEKRPASQCNAYKPPSPGKFYKTS